MNILSARLKAAADMAVNANRIIDVGCDHGYLSAYMILERSAHYAYACDINIGPLNNAERTACQYKLQDKIEFRLCNGLDSFSGEECDTVFICGMGGELIADILSRAPWTADGKHILVLQPMTKADYLRRFLFENNYKIDLEQAVYDDNRLYCVIRAKGGNGDCGENNGFMYSDSFVKNMDFYQYIDKMLSKYRDIYSGKLTAGCDTSEEIRIINLLEEAYANR